MTTDVLLLDAEEAAKSLGVSRATLYVLISKGELRGVRLGRARRFPRAELEGLVARLQVQAEADANGPVRR